MFRTPGDGQDLPDPATDSNGFPIEEEPFLTSVEPGIIETRLCVLAVYNASQGNSSLTPKISERHEVDRLRDQPP